MPQITIDVDAYEVLEELTDDDLIKELKSRERRASKTFDFLIDPGARDDLCRDTLLEAWRTRDEILFERALRLLDPPKPLPSGPMNAGLTQVAH